MEGPGLTIAAGRPRRQRRTRITADGSDDEYGGGGTSSRLRVRMGHGHGGQQSANPADSVGWDRELDSDPDEPLAVEEHFVLRVPPEVAPKLKEQVDRRDVPADVWFKFKDSRRAVFHVDNKLYGAKLVDLPALLESQRLTGVGGQTVKVADVSQMLLVEEQIREEHDVTRDKVFNIEDFVYPHGITPPLKHVRKRRFRKRINRRVRLRKGRSSSPAIIDTAAISRRQLSKSRLLLKSSSKQMRGQKKFSSVRVRLQLFSPTRLR